MDLIIPASTILIVKEFFFWLIMTAFGGCVVFSRLTPLNIKLQQNTLNKKRISSFLIKDGVGFRFFLEVLLIIISIILLKKTEHFPF